jgi:hypothetical protein
MIDGGSKLKGGSGREYCYVQWGICIMRLCGNVDEGERAGRKGR